ADGGTPRQITRGKWNVGAHYFNMPTSTALVWTKDGKNIVFDGLTSEAEILYRQASNINKVNVKTGEITRITKEDGFWYGPKLSTDGRVMAFSGYEVSKLTSPGENIFMSNMDGSNFRKITDGLANAPALKGWSRDGTGLYFQMGADGTQNLYFATLKGRVVPVTKGQHMLNISSISASGDVVGTRTSPKQPLDAFYLNLRNPKAIRQLTHVNDDVLEGIELGDVEEIWYTSSDNTRVQGWIVKPPQFDASKKYPLILKIHGGPHAMYDVRFRYDMQENAAKGYVTLYTNPRGSTGYGADFANAIDNAYPGRADFDDLMTGVDDVLSRGYIDQQRMYVTGCSGGGVLTSWVVSHTDRFKAAAALCPVINWISFAGTADIIGWAYNRFDGYFWDDPTKWLEHSPLMHVNKVKTPTLLMTGLKDLRTPIDQAEEFYTALKMLGVPTKLVGVHGEYHGTSSIPSNFIRTQLILRKWFEEHGGEAGPK
ncbi:MAG: S9 family peptidase, partial [Sphingomonadales bacterium]|nr:S9 family peptidase [Sphingomonadales bacterium]